MIGLTVIEFIAFGMTCTILGAVAALNLTAKKAKAKTDMDQMREWVRTLYRN